MVNDYGMFTADGNNRVHQIVEFAKGKLLEWEDTYSLLESLASKEGFEEATDTMVRELVYDACGFTTDFYI
jgi:hypothetical protein